MRPSGDGAHLPLGLRAGPYNQNRKMHVAALLAHKTCKRLSERTLKAREELSYRAGGRIGKGALLYQHASRGRSYKARITFEEGGEDVGC